MFNGKVENLHSLEEPGFINAPLQYLMSRNIMAGSKTGASDITFIYKNEF